MIPNFGEISKKSKKKAVKRGMIYNFVEIINIKPLFRRWYLCIQII